MDYNVPVVNYKKKLHTKLSFKGFNSIILDKGNDI